ncbi:MAG: hypothetical protein Q7J04_08475 [Microcella sp.]|nr:hypothetical protein [Microcella sp.]
MDEILAFPIPVDGAASPWLAPVFGLMALTGFTVVIWQAVRYLRNSDDDVDPRFDDEPDGPPRDDRVE